jgi:hypothetical protein
MTTPICPTCRTDKYLKYTDFQPATTEEIRLPVAGGITRSRDVAPVVQFFCRKCGYSNGYSVDVDWTPPADTVTDDDLRALVTYWEAPHRSVTVTEGGGTAIRFGA